MPSTDQTLVLAADFQPIKIVSWDEAFNQVLKKAAILVHEHGDNRIRAGQNNFNGTDISSGVVTGIDALRTFDENGHVIWKRPSVIREAVYHKRKRIIRFSRESVWLRDGGRCQYCQKQCGRHSFTYDHTIPKSKGGKTNFENIVVCCIECNQIKGGRTPQEAGMKLVSTPVVPKSLPHSRIAIHNMPSIFPEEWQWYMAEKQPELYWNVSLEKDK